MDLPLFKLVAAGHSLNWNMLHHTTRRSWRCCNCGSRPGNSFVVVIVALIGGCERPASERLRETAGLQTATSNSVSQPTDDSPPPARMSTAPAPGNSSDSVTGSPAETSQSIERSNHPIDQLPHGGTFRDALDALDHGDRATAERLRDRLPDDPQSTVLSKAIEAVMLAQQDESDQALKAAEEISRIPAMRAEAYMIAGEVFRRQHRWAKAIGAYESALQSHPTNIRAHRWLGVIYHDTGAMRRATNHLRKAAELDSGDFRSLRLSGRIHYDYQSFEEAVKDYSQALQRSPPASLEAEIRVELADSLRELRQIDDALKALAPCDDSIDVLVARAQCWEARGETDRAVRLVRRAIELDAADPEANFVLGRILLTQRSFQQAIRHLRLAVDAKPSDHEPRFLLGRALLQAGREQAGRQELKRSAELKKIFLKMAELHLDAIDRPNDVNVRFQLGELAEQLGRPAIARSWYKAALGLDPEHQQAAAAFERLQDAAG